MPRGSNLKDDPNKNKGDHWWEISDSDSEIPQKEHIPPPPRNLAFVDKYKYNLAHCMEDGQVKEHMKQEAYERYYSAKFQSMQEKKAMAIYKDFLSRVKQSYSKKKSQLLVDKSQFNNYGQQLLCLPAKSRARVR